MALHRNLIGYFRGYGKIAALSIAASSLFEVLDLVVPYVIGQILNVLSKQLLDAPLLALINTVATGFNLTASSNLALASTARGCYC